MPSGLASCPVEELRDRIVAAWRDFLAVAVDADLSRASRLPGWRGHDVCAHLGAWPDRDTLGEVLASARAGAENAPDAPPAEPLDVDELNARIVAEHAGASRAELFAAMEHSRDRVLDWLASGEVGEVAELSAMSWLGPIPVLGLVHASTYELAVHALDLAPCGAPPPGAALLDAGLASLTDMTGALAARQGIRTTVSAVSPAGGWQFSTSELGWVTRKVAPDAVAAVRGPAVRGSAVDILDASAGRVAPIGLVLNRRLRMQDLPGFLRLTPIVEAVPALPGGSALRGAAKALSGAGSLLSRVPGLRGWG